MFDLNETINWKPNRQEKDVLELDKNANDWNLSVQDIGDSVTDMENRRQTRRNSSGSVEELYNEIEKSIAAGFKKKNPFKGFEVGNMDDSNYDLIDLHKNVVDEITLVSASGKPMMREADLIDVWFDSGSMPYAQWHYPFENKDKIDENKDFPADFIAEGVDQTRGWFYTLHAIGTLVLIK
jgi:isoleucyl-tRNA synthetase